MFIALYSHSMLILMNRLHGYAKLTRLVSSDPIDRYILTKKMLTVSDFQPDSYSPRKTA